MSTERDLAHEADMEQLRREQLRGDIDPTCDCDGCREQRDFADSDDAYDPVLSPEDIAAYWADQADMLDQEQPD